MVAGPEVKFDLNVEIRNSKTRFALLKFSPRQLPARITMGSTALRLRPLTFCDLRARYDCIQVMFSCLNSSLHIHRMLNLISADSYTPVPYSNFCKCVNDSLSACVLSEWALPAAAAVICADPKSDLRRQLPIYRWNLVRRLHAANPRAFLQSKLLSPMFRTMKSCFLFRHAGLCRWQSNAAFVLRPQATDQIAALMLKNAEDWIDKLFCQRKNITEPKHRSTCCPKALQHVSTLKASNSNYITWVVAKYRRCTMKPSNPARLVINNVTCLYKL